MTNEPPRKLTIADSLVLTAGTAIAFGLLRVAGGGFGPGEVWDALVRPKAGWSLGYAFELSLEFGIAIGIPCLAGWTPACLLLALQRPRARWRRFRREPGFVACLLATVVVALTAAAALAYAWLDSAKSNHRFETFLAASLLCGCVSGSAILGCWATMMLTHTWRPAQTWTDRLGRLTGVAWLVHGGLCLCYFAIVTR